MSETGGIKKFIWNNWTHTERCCPLLVYIYYIRYVFTELNSRGAWEEHLLQKVWHFMPFNSNIYTINCSEICCKFNNGVSTEMTNQKRQEKYFKAGFFLNWHYFLQLSELNITKLNDQLANFQVTWDFSETMSKFKKKEKVSCI